MFNFWEKRKRNKDKQREHFSIENMKMQLVATKACSQEKTKSIVGKCEDREACVADLLVEEGASLVEVLMLNEARAVEGNRLKVRGVCCPLVDTGGSIWRRTRTSCCRFISQQLQC